MAARSLGAGIPTTGRDSNRDIRRVACLVLPGIGGTRVYPAHGAGSLCGRSIGKETWSTIGRERQMNPALVDRGREAFVADITRDVPETPVYFLHSRDLNRQGPALRAGAEMPPMLTPREFAAAAREGAVMLDTRSPAAYGAAHPVGSINVGLDGQYASWVGTLVQPEDPGLGDGGYVGGESQPEDPGLQ